MARKKTREELERENESLRAYQEAFWCLLRGEKPERFSSGEGEDERAIWVLGVSRACGGIALNDDEGKPGGSAAYVSTWRQATTRPGASAYDLDLAHQVERYCVRNIRRLFHVWIATGDRCASSSFEGAHIDEAKERAANTWRVPVHTLAAHPSTECHRREC